MANFEKATRENWSFKTSKGQINVIDLWKLNVSTLKDAADEMDKELESLGKSGRRRDTSKTVAQKLLEEKISLVDYITEVKEKEAAEALSRAADKNRTAQRLALLDEADNEAEIARIKNMTAEERAAERAKLAGNL